MAKRKEVENVDVDGVQVSSTLSADGRLEYPDPVPAAPPLDYSPPDQLNELIRQYIRRELSQIAAKDEYETFEEADDFDIEDDPLDPLTPYERVFDPAPTQKPSESVAPTSAAPKANAPVVQEPAGTPKGAEAGVSSPPPGSPPSPGTVHST